MATGKYDLSHHIPLLRPYFETAFLPGLAPPFTSETEHSSFLATAPQLVKAIVTSRDIDCMTDGCDWATASFLQCALDLGLRILTAAAAVATLGPSSASQDTEAGAGGGEFKEGDFTPPVSPLNRIPTAYELLVRVSLEIK
jgi:hypothetical protein